MEMHSKDTPLPIAAQPGAFGSRASRALARAHAASASFMRRGARAGDRSGAGAGRAIGYKVPHIYKVGQEGLALSYSEQREGNRYQSGDKPTSHTSSQPGRLLKILNIPCPDTQPRRSAHTTQRLTRNRIRGCCRTSSRANYCRWRRRPGRCSAAVRAMAAVGADN